ncbi:Gamma-aminobutyric acid receptor subunit alpha-6 [Nymphon striatum]|nr:Gamma-aminobutyric acid receptor subunit alpha-6 [Nymphon striatum]KAG1695934.1 Gamma-aminobutyric acid receptor subunit alpha-6 [Nymphon striatum]
MALLRFGAGIGCMRFTDTFEMIRFYEKIQNGEIQHVKILIAAGIFRNYPTTLFYGIFDKPFYLKSFSRCYKLNNMVDIIKLIFECGLEFNYNSVKKFVDRLRRGREVNPIGIINAKCFEDHIRFPLSLKSLGRIAARNAIIRTKEYFGNVSAASKEEIIFEKILAKYNLLQRPNPEKATKVKVNIHVISLGGIDPNKMEFEVSMFFRQKWTDPRFLYSDASINLIKLKHEQLNKIWMPDTFFVNKKDGEISLENTPERFLRITLSNGEILSSTRLTMKKHCAMSLSNFPLDQHICSVKIESYGYVSDEMKYSIENVYLDNSDFHSNKFSLLKQKTCISENFLAFSAETKYRVLYRSIHPTKFNIGFHLLYFVLVASNSKCD